MAYRIKNVETGTKATQFLEKKYINGIFLAVLHHNCPFDGQKHPMRIPYLDSIKSFLVAVTFNYHGFTSFWPNPINAYLGSNITFCLHGHHEQIMESLTLFLRSLTYCLWA
jgi:hypothetical protein